MIEVKLADGRVVEIDDEDGERACVRAANLFQADAVAWRWPRVYVGPVHHSQIIG